MTSSTCSSCQTAVSVGLQVVTRNPWTKKYDLWRYCCACASRLGEFDTSVEEPASKPQPTKRKRQDSQPFALQLDEVKR
jgi:hypothetical protein